MKGSRTGNIEHLLQWKVLGNCIPSLVAIRRLRVLTSVLQSHPDNKVLLRFLVADEYGRLASRTITRV